MLISAAFIFLILHSSHTALGTDFNNKTESDICLECGIWGPILEDWTVTNHREKRILHFSTPVMESGFVAIERSDILADKDGKESKIAPGKIVTSGVQNPNVNNFNVNRKPPTPGRQVSETDLYLLGAIEKLVYRVDFMEKRLRRVEEMMYFVMAGNRIDQDPCPNNFSRAGNNCYLFLSQAGREMDWKAASKQCYKFGAVLAEMETIEENQDVIAHIQSTTHLKGKDFWTGGLNPGLLWIWSNSARPVQPENKDPNKKNPVLNITGEGRCLRLAYNPALRSYNYKGSDCSVRYNYICEKPETTSSNEVKRIGREKNIFKDEL